MFNLVYAVCFCSLYLTSVVNVIYLCKEHCNVTHQCDERLQLILSLRSVNLWFITFLHDHRTRVFLLHGHREGLAPPDQRCKIGTGKRQTKERSCMKVMFLIKSSDS